MGRDIARRSFDESRKYRGVIAQQGRVTLEADTNEARETAGAELRYLLTELVGPCGTPDDGYKVTPLAAWGLSIGAGTMYTGGVRTTLEAAISYDGQTALDWRDGPAPTPASQRELVVLWLEEQEVSAVEDEALREIALGGPDTAGRARIRQRIARLATDATKCEDAWTATSKSWAELGLEVDAHQLRSLARLHVKFAPTAASNKCEPEAKQGYLGAENQLIRVQIAEPRAGQGKPAALWGYDNASFLYRAEAQDVAGKKRQLKLASRPVDEHHRPRKDQVVEVLRTAVDLGSGNYVAAPTGFVTTLAAAYDGDKQTLLLTDALPSEYTDKTKTPQLFVRVWENRHEFEPDKPFDLKGPGTGGELVGLQITLSQGVSAITGKQPEHFVPGDHWLVAVRPSEPQQVYPQRYQQAPQPPDGPRRWACPLAVVGWANGAGTLLSDCRKPFDDLVTVTQDIVDIKIEIEKIKIEITNIWIEIEKLKRQKGGCCTLQITPEDVEKKGLWQRLLAELAELLRSPQRRVILCLKPGTYRLHAPLVLGEEHSRLTIESCGGAVELVPLPKGDRRFSHGIVIVRRATGVTLRGLVFKMAYFPFAEADEGFAGLRDTEAAGAGFAARELIAAFGVRAVACTDLTVTDCVFDFPELKGEAAQALSIAAGLFNNGATRGLTVRGSTFSLQRHEQKVDDISRHFSIGIAAQPTSFLAPIPAEDYLHRPKLVHGKTLPASLDGVTLDRNEIAGPTAAVYVLGELGEIRLTDNRVRECMLGFHLQSPRSAGLLYRLQGEYAEALRGEGSRPLRLALQMLANPIHRRGSALFRGFPLPDPESAELLVETSASDPQEVERMKAETSKLLALFRDARRWFTPEEHLDDAAVEALAAKLEALAAETPLDRALHYLESARDEEAEAQSARRLNLSITGNDVDVLLAAPTQALHVSDVRDDTTDTAIVSHNRLRNRALEQPTAYIAYVHRCSVTGNVIVNEHDLGRDRLLRDRLFREAETYFHRLALDMPAEARERFVTDALDELRRRLDILERLDHLLDPQPDRPAEAEPDGPRYASLVVVPRAEGGAASVAVTGNVLHGPSRLPSRPRFAPPFDDWRLFNSGG